MREKLVALIKQCHECRDIACDKCTYFNSPNCAEEHIADYLLANGVTISNPNATSRCYEAEWKSTLDELKIRCCEIEELKHLCDRLRDENSKLGLQYEKLLKEKSDLDRKMGYLEGQVEAYKFIWGCRK